MVTAHLLPLDLRTCLKSLTVGMLDGKLDGCATINYTEPT